VGHLVSGATFQMAGLHSLDTRGGYIQFVGPAGVRAPTREAVRCISRLPFSNSCGVNGPTDTGVCMNSFYAFFRSAISPENGLF